MKDAKDAYYQLGCSDNAVQAEKETAKVWKYIQDSGLVYKKHIQDYGQIYQIYLWLWSNT